MDVRLHIVFLHPDAKVPRVEILVIPVVDCHHVFIFWTAPFYVPQIHGLLLVTINSRLLVSRVLDPIGLFLTSVFVLHGSALVLDVDVLVAVKRSSVEGLILVNPSALVHVGRVGRVVLGRMFAAVRNRDVIERGNVQLVITLVIPDNEPT